MTDISALPVPQPTKEIFPSRRDFSIAFHAWLNGSSGSNRTPRDRVAQLIEADHDTDAIETWLNAKKRNRPNTLLSYRREAYRLLAWALWFREKPISSLTLGDVADFQAWLLDPKAHQEWIRRGWVLIRGPLRTSSARQALNILSGMFHWLVEAGYLLGNPFRLFDQCPAGNESGNSAEAPIKHAFDKALWDWMLAKIDSYVPADKDSLEYRSFERCRFALIFMYWTGISGHELLIAKMSQITKEGEVSILQLKGKDGRYPERVVLLPPAIDALRRYRASRGLSELPTPAEQHIPLVAAHRGRKSITVMYLNLLLKELFAKLAEDAKHFDNQWAEELSVATTRWLRYTLVAHNAQAGVPIQDITQQLRYKTMETPRRIYRNISRLEELNLSLAKLLDYGTGENKLDGDLSEP